MQNVTRYTRILLFVALSGVPLFSQASEEDRDPWEPVNRVVFKFNLAVDEAVLKPVAEVYTLVAPEPVEQGVRNFFANIGEIRNATNNLFQAKWRETLTSSGRFVINSTVGIGGLFDVAGHIGLAAEQEDFGQTLGHWGVPSGPYLVIPLFGPSSVRDSTGKFADVWLSPLQYTNLDLEQRTGLVILDGVQTRVDLLASDNLFAGDSYIVIREAFLSKQAYDTRDGSPSSDPFFDKSDDENLDDEGYIDESF